MARQLVSFSPVKLSLLWYKRKKKGQIGVGLIFSALATNFCARSQKLCSNLPADLHLGHQRLSLLSWKSRNNKKYFQKSKEQRAKSRDLVDLIISRERWKIINNKKIFLILGINFRILEYSLEYLNLG